ncbi:hypothetical protein HAX54_026649 [Datura stramonium]|uniref:Uncharacterized protein n=1 Tax=Datura stramonium TaxID=4076 RepID=A0ABS8V3U5_DATST|nr:hypothetical protein [Datura stramonium]
MQQPLLTRSVHTSQKFTFQRRRSFILHMRSVLKLTMLLGCCKKSQLGRSEEVPYCRCWFMGPLSCGQLLQLSDIVLHIMFAECLQDVP